MDNEINELKNILWNDGYPDNLVKKYMSEKINMINFDTFSKKTLFNWSMILKGIYGVKNKIVSEEHSMSLGCVRSSQINQYLHDK